MAMHKVRSVVSACVVLMCATSVVVGESATLGIDDIPGKDLARGMQNQFGVSEASSGINNIISSDMSSGRGDDCWVYDKDGTVVQGACYQSGKGPEKPLDYRVPLTSHNMVVNALEDEHFGNQIIGRVLTTSIGNAVAAFNFGQPAAGQILETSLNYAQSEASLCQQTHVQYFSDLASGPGGDAEAKAYLGCIRKYNELNLGNNPQLDGSPKGPLCQAISVCQNDDYLSHVERGKAGSNVLPADRFESTPGTAFIPTDNECHPDNPRLLWTDPYDTATPALRKNRLLFSDLLFCEYHQTNPGSNGYACQSRRIDTTRGNSGKSPEEIICDTGLGNEQFLKQYVGNFAIFRYNQGAINQGVVSSEWQSVAPYTLPWPPTGGAEKPAPEVYSLYRGGETFTYLMQMMRNRCEFHNAMNGVTTAESAIYRVVNPSSGTLTVHNGRETSTVAMEEVRKNGFCGSQQEIIQAHRAALSLPGLLFDEATCDVMWYKTKSHFHQNTYACEELTGCIDAGSAAGRCDWEFAKIVENPDQQPQWVLLLAAYSKVMGDMQWREHLQALNYHIKQMTRGKDSWYLNKAQELIQSRLTADLNNTIEVSKAELGKEIDRLVREKNDNASSIISNGKTSDNPIGINPNA